MIFYSVHLILSLLCVKYTHNPKKLDSGIHCSVVRFLNFKVLGKTCIIFLYIGCCMELFGYTLNPTVVL